MDKTTERPEGPRPGLYLHWRGGLYLVPGVVVADEADGTPRVPYYSLRKLIWWSRRPEDFGFVGQLGPGVVGPRFEHLGLRRLRHALRHGVAVAALSFAVALMERRR